MTKHWLVIKNQSRGGTGIEWFSTREEAEKLARLKAARMPGTKIIILQAVAWVEAPLPHPELIIHDMNNRGERHETRRGRG